LLLKPVAVVAVDAQMLRAEVAAAAVHTVTAFADFPLTTAVITRHQGRDRRSCASFCLLRSLRRIDLAIRSGIKNPKIIMNTSTAIGSHHLMTHTPLPPPAGDDHDQKMQKQPGGRGGQAADQPKVATAGIEPTF